MPRLNYMLVKAIFLALSFTSLNHGAAATSNSPLSDEEQFNIRGLYTVDATQAVLDATTEAIKATLIPWAEYSWSTANEHLHYPSPDTLQSKREIPPLARIIHKLRDAHDLPTFLAYNYKTRDECTTAYRTFLTDQNLPPEKLDEITKAFDAEYEAMETLEASLMQKYAEFYHRRTSTLRRQGFVTYLCELLLTPPTMDTEEALHNRTQLVATLQSTGFLTLHAPMIDGRLHYSPALQVAEHIKRHGTPTRIILGCTHSKIRSLSEQLFIGDEAWCGCCTLSHDGEMVVSLHEGAADIITDLNHPDLWRSIRDSSVQYVKDETWEIVNYSPETLAQIVRVLTPGGTFCCDSYDEDAHAAIVVQLQEFGLVSDPIEIIPISDEYSRKVLHMHKP